MSISSIYPTFETSSNLFAWLRSDAGGRLFVRESSDSDYAIIYYKKSQSNMSMPHVKASRSVIWNKYTNTVVLVSPAHGRAMSTITASERDTVTSVEEFVDGVMINLFYDPDPAQQKWRVATRTCLDATNTFYGTKSFASLFWETIASIGLSVNDLDKHERFSWVLTHPEERIVVPCLYGIPRLVLIPTNPRDSYHPSLRALFPKKYSVPASQIEEFVFAEGKRFGTSWQGVVVHTPTDRFKLRSNEYNVARHLRGNQAKKSYLWLERWSENRLGAYLRLFPEEQHDATTCIDSFKILTQEVYDWYSRVYKKHELPLGQVPQKFRKLLWDAHTSHAGSYFQNLVVFMNKQDIARKLWLVNYETRFPKVTGGVFGTFTDVFGVTV